VEVNKLLEEKIEAFKRMERALHESHQLLEKTFAGLDEAVLVVEPNSRTILKVNPAVESIFGYSEEETLGRNTEFLHVDKTMYQEFGQELFLALDKDGVYRSEYRMRRKDGSTIFTEHTVSEILDDSGHRVGVVSIVRDITTRKRAEDELHDSLSLLSSTLESTADGILVVDLQGNIVSFNQKFVDIWGIPDAIIASKDDRQALAFVLDQLKDPEAFLTKVKELYSQPEAESYDTLEFKDGKILERYSQSQKKGGHIIGRVWSFRDVTDRKRAEQALRESEHYFRSLLFNMHEDILVIDRDYRITDANNTLLVTTGLEYDEVIGQHCYEISHRYNEPCGRKGEDCKLREVFETGKPENCRHQHLRGDGSKVWVDILLSPLKDENGNVSHVIEAIRDVSDLVEMGEVLRESEENFRTLAENANDGILIAAGEEGVNLYANKRAAEITGYSVTELQDIGLRQLVAPDQVKKVTDRYKRRLAGKNVPSQYEAKLVRKNKEIFSAELSSARSAWKGEPASIILIRDITRRKRAEEAVRKSEAELLEKSRHLEEVNAALKALLRQRENDKADLEQRLHANVKELVLPYVEKLKNSRSYSDRMTLLGILESNVTEIVSPFVTKLSTRFLSLTPTEIQVAGLIKDGKTSKEVAVLINASENTVRSHRFHIRSKLGIKNKKVNLRSYLQSIQD
jgi:PAS domain S-box-containing protein